MILIDYSRSGSSTTAGESILTYVLVLTAPGYPGVRGYPMFEPYPPQVPTVIRAINKWNTVMLLTVIEMALKG